MLAVLGTFSIAASIGLLYLGIAANRRVPPAAWTENWILDGFIAPGIITLFGLGIIAWGYFFVDVASQQVGWAELVIVGALAVSAVLGWFVVRGGGRAVGRT